jgi:hypothetical protein
MLGRGRRRHHPAAPTQPDHDQRRHDGHTTRDNDNHDGHHDNDVRDDRIALTA